jgi:hypothetical protein
LASFSSSWFFSPVEFEGETWMSGSTVWDLDVFSVVNKCLEHVPQQNIIVDVILTSEKKIAEIDAQNYKTPQVFMRYLEVNKYYNSM